MLQIQIKWSYNLDIKHFIYKNIWKAPACDEDYF